MVRCKPNQILECWDLCSICENCIFKLGYRETSGIVEDYERQYSVENIPNFRTIRWWIKKLRKDLVDIGVLLTQLE